MKSVISWFANNSVAANLSMLLIIISGLMVLPLIDREIIPDITFDKIEIVVGLPGSGPTQVERSISRTVEQALVGIDGILDVTTIAKKHVSITSLEISNQVSLNEVINKIRARMDAVSFPKEASRPIVREVVVIEPVIALALSGNKSLEDLNGLAEIIVNDLRALPSVSVVYIQNGPIREYLVEVSENNLQRYGVSFSEIMKALHAVAADISGATINTEDGDVSVIGESKINNSASLESLAIRSSSDGARISLSDLADVQDKYQVNNRYKKFDKDNVVYIGINRAQNEDLLDLANNVETFIKNTNQNLPNGVTLQKTNDISKAVSGRIDLLTSNAIGGFFLVLLVLLLFMNLRLSFWTSLGIPISFLGAFIILFYGGGSLNMVSLFSFILVLGIVVDDAIIVGESIYQQHENNNFGIDASIKGALDVYKPVVFAVLTTMIAFAPMLFMPGEEGRLIFIVPVVVIAVLAFSLIESLLILPSHLAGIAKGSNELLPILNKAQKRFSGMLNVFIKNKYTPNLEKALVWRYSTVVFFIMLFLVTVSLLLFRWVNVNVVSNIASDTLIVYVNMIEDTPLEETKYALKKLESDAFELKNEVNAELGFEQISHIASALHDSDDTRAIVTIFLNSSLNREVDNEELQNRLVEKFGALANVQSIQIKTSIVGLAPDIDIELTHRDISVLETASADLLKTLKSYKGVRSGWVTLSQGKQEIGFSLKPQAGDMGVTNAQVAAQIRQVFHGEVVRIHNEKQMQVPVRVQYPENQRNSIWFLENLKIPLKDGSTVPLYRVADLNYRDAPASINLHNGKRSTRVRSNISDKVSEAQIMASLNKDFFEEFKERYPGVTWKRSGGQQRSHEILDYLFFAYPLSLLMMYLLMATLFGSYTQPLMIMGAIPFGIVGALIGHLFLGVSVTLWSLIGIIAVSGVVVNDNLVLVDRINQSLKSGVPLLEAIREAGVVRFRPIVLTSTTTFLGLAPLMFETSVQAQFLVPMAVSLGFGVLFATVISLILVPVFYAILFDFQVLIEKQGLLERFNAFVRKALNSDQEI
jgi:multidrug efflux pump subunit AcrB